MKKDSDVIARKRCVKHNTDEAISYFCDGDCFVGVVHTFRAFSPTYRQVGNDKEMWDAIVSLSGRQAMAQCF